MPQLRRRVRAPGSCACRAPGVRAARPWRRRRLCRCRTRRPRWSTATRWSEQTARLAVALPERPLVLGGCCCAHTGAIRGLAARAGRLAVVWLDAHGDLNTPETSPSGNEWGMPLRAALDEGSVRPEDVALVGARNLDPPEVEYMRASGIDDDVDARARRCRGGLRRPRLRRARPSAISCFMPEPDGPYPGRASSGSCVEVAGSGPAVAGLGLTGLRPDADVDTLTRLPVRLGL